MKNFKKIISLCIAIILILSCVGYALEIHTFSESLTVYLNGIDVYENSTNKPLIMNDRTMVPLRPIFEKMGWSNEEISYDELEQKAFFKGGNCSCEFINDNNIAKKYDENGNITEINLDVPATIYNGNFYIPLRVFCDLWGFNITWIDESRSVYIAEKTTTNVVLTPNDVEISNLDWYPEDHMAIEYMVHEGIMPLDENNDFNGTTPMTVAEINDTIARFVVHTADKYNIPELKNDIPQIIGRNESEIVTLKDVVDLLCDPGITLDNRKTEWVELNQSRLIAAFKAIYNITIPNDAVEEFATLMPIPAYVASMIYESMDMWRLLTDYWNDGYTKQLNGINESEKTIATFDGHTYYYIVDEKNNDNDTGVYSETGGNTLRFTALSKSIDLIGAYNGYMFYIYQGNIWRINSDGKFNRQLTYDGKLPDLGHNDPYYKNARIFGNEIYYCYGTPGTGGSRISKYYKAPITASNFDNNEIRTEITEEEYNNTKKIDGNTYTSDGITLGLGLSSYEIRKNNTGSFDVHSSSRPLFIGAVTYNGYVYHIFKDDKASDVSYLNRVDINGQNCENIATINNIDGDCMSVCGDYVFAKYDDEYIRININESSNEYGVINKGFNFDNSYTDVEYEVINKIDSTEALRATLIDLYEGSMWGAAGDTWAFTMVQATIDCLAFEFKKDGTLTVTGIPDINKPHTTRKMSSTYQIIDRETVDIKWDLFNWRENIDNNKALESMKVTRFRLVDDKTLEGTEKIQDYFEEWTPVIGVMSKDAVILKNLF